MALAAQEIGQQHSFQIPIMDPVKERPRSALGTRGVQIQEFQEVRMNPEPIVMEETDILLEEYLSPRKLRLLTGIEDLNEVKYLEMKVDTTETSLGNFGAMVPNLSQLKLSNSIITTVRDLGSVFPSLRVLWMARCGLQDLDGLSSMSNLQELYLAYNEISDISACSMLEKLKILDLEGNNIDDISQIEFLALCSSLTNLTLEGNPVCLTPAIDKAAPDYDYRQAVKKCVPNLQYLDDEPLLLETSGIRKLASAFDDDWKLIQELLDEGSIGSTDSLETTGNVRPGSAIRPTTGYRPGSALRPPTSLKRSGTAAGRPSTSAAARPGTAAKGSDESIESPDDGSDLTMGGVICGNPSKALRARRKTDNPTQPPPLFAHFKHVPEHTYDPILEEDTDMKELWSELKEWRIDQEERIKKIEESRAPQVLKIDFDDTENVLTDSDDEGDTNDDFYPVQNSLDFENTNNITHSSSDFSASHSSDVASSYDEAEAVNTSIKHSPRDERMGSSSPKPPEKGTKPRSAELKSRRFRLRSNEDSQTFSNNKSPVIPDEKQGDGSPVPQNRPLLNKKDIKDIPNKGYREKVTLQSTRSRSFDNVDTGIPVVAVEDDRRPHSGPVAPTGKFKLDKKVDKYQPKDIDRSKPVIRALPHSPEVRVLPGPRAITARAALGQQAGRTKRQLPKVPLLPSKPTMPK